MYTEVKSGLTESLTDRQATHVAEFQQLPTAISAM